MYVLVFLFFEFIKSLIFYHFYCKRNISALHPFALFALQGIEAGGCEWAVPSVDDVQRALSQWQNSL